MISLDSIPTNDSDIIDAIVDLVSISNSTISNQLSSASIFLTIVSILLALIGVGLGIYITGLYAKVKDFNDVAENDLKKASELKNEIDLLNSQINNNLHDLYQRLKDEETRSILNRLIEQPLDICNIGESLLSRDIDASLFGLLKEAYLNLLNTGHEDEIASITSNTYKNCYYLLFFQHFFFQTILDDDLRGYLPIFYDYGMNCEFKRDIIKTTKDMCKALSLNKVNFDKEGFLCDYLIHLNTSKYQKDVDVKEILETEIDDRYLLPSTIEGLIKRGIKLHMFE